ncbi:MAG TPA: bifunctional phosphopantothenoylcysteine decarboxylase/phosphopantothenate--cysteine ligase CoaBC [Alphaproteobacteria bacterium]|jgi:phosphopantothenoylcysteine decarboxylase/phosphopantothenate--cysteine ligase|nr:bifunctional phosphopantothenoylcysteine decarboxylase/phosphopantothenate--cysteine ligase CoaBC [Alphaproteobacteria bacterium]
MTDTKRILLIISGGIAAYKSLTLIRRLRERNIAVRCVLSVAAAKFVTPLTVGALSGDKVYSDLFSLTDEQEMGHIRLSREADLVVVAPASADLLAKAANGLADDLASTILLATDKPVLIAPSMNTEMWEHPATQRNLAILAGDGVHRVGPDEGDLACGEIGAGRVAEPDNILATIEAMLAGTLSDLASVRALVTSGPTQEPIDPVRYIGNRSSGKQGYAIAQALAALGADVTLITGPTKEPDPLRARVIRIQTAEEMLAACLKALPVDVAVCAAAVSDWRASVPANQKIKRSGKSQHLELIENPDILGRLSAAQPNRPTLVVGFAAETESVIENATKKRLTKGCDWIIANDVSQKSGVFGSTHNKVHVIDEIGVEDWPVASKAVIAERLAARIASKIACRSIVP